MEIRRLIRKNRGMVEDNSQTFHSFEEVFDYCLNCLENMTQHFDEQLFKFKILDSNEEFIISGKANGEDSYIYGGVDFVKRGED